MKTESSEFLAHRRRIEVTCYLVGVGLAARRKVHHDGGGPILPFYRDLRDLQNFLED